MKRKDKLAEKEIEMELKMRNKEEGRGILKVIERNDREEWDNIIRSSYNK